MKRLFLLLFLTIIYNVSSAQGGWGYVNYTSYRTHNGNGSTSQYSQFANNANDFVNMMNTANSNTTITHSGQTTLAAMCDGSNSVPRWGNDYFAYKFEFWFVPQETGSYRFGINSDDASDLSVNGVIVTTYYGGHGASAYQYGNINLVAGNSYKIVARMQEFGGGEAFFLRWSRPSAPTTYSYWTNEVTNIQPNNRSVKYNFTFTNVNPVNFSVNTLSFLNNSWSINSTNTTQSLNSSGVVDVSNSLDTSFVNDGTSKSFISAGDVEYSYININNGVNTLYIDLRTFNGIQPSNVNSVSILDIYDGPVTYQSSDIYWASYIVPSPIPKVSDGTSLFNLNIRNTGFGNYAFRCNITFSSNQSYKQQAIKFTNLRTDTINAMLDRIVTVGDVYLAFKEFSDGGGIFGGGSGTQFTSGIQFMNADVDGNNVFDERDCFRLLQHLTGQKNLLDTLQLSSFLKMFNKTTYNLITTSNWKNQINRTTDMFTGLVLNKNTMNYSYDINTTWRGDVNMSHSPTQVILNGSLNSISSSIYRQSVETSIPNASIISETSGDTVIVNIKFDPKQNQITANQFIVVYDNTILKFEDVKFMVNQSAINFKKDRGTYINFGSLITTEGVLDNKTEYMVMFKTKQKLNNSLGLFFISTTEAINNNGETLKIQIK